MKTALVRLLMLALVCFGLRHTTLARPMTTVRAWQERQKEIERQIRENERRQTELRNLRQEEESTTQAEWLHYLEQLRASNLEIRVAIEQEKSRWDNSCCATLENGEKCENTVCSGEWFCLAHRDPPRDAIEEPVLAEVEVVPDPLADNVSGARLRNKREKTVNQERMARKSECSSAVDGDDEHGKSVVWIAAAGASVLFVVILVAFRKRSPPRKGYAKKRLRRTGVGS